MDWLKKNGVITALLIFAVLIMVLGIGIIKLNTKFDPNPIVFNGPNEMGDYFSGTVGPLLSFSSSLLFLVALLYQRLELKYNREEIALNRDEMKASREVAINQILNSIVYKQIDYFNAEFDRIKKENGTITTDSFFKRIQYNILKNETIPPGIFDKSLNSIFEYQQLIYVGESTLELVKDSLYPYNFKPEFYELKKALLYKLFISNISIEAYENIRELYEILEYIKSEFPQYFTKENFDTGYEYKFFKLNDILNSSRNFLKINVKIRMPMSRETFNN